MNPQTQVGPQINTNHKNSSNHDMFYEKIIVVVNFGQASKVLKIAKKHGISGGTIFLGKGTIKGKLRDLFELNDVRKEIVFMAANRTLVANALEALNSELKLYKPYHGIAFTTPVMKIHGCHIVKDESHNEIGGVENSMYHIIYTIVEKGRAEDVIDAATKAGSKGGTIINARGSGIHETQTLFSMPIEPEKEIVMIISDVAVTDKITESIRTQLDIDKPGNGIIFVQEVLKTYGLSQNI